MTSSPGQLTWGACHIEGLYPYAVSFYACKVLRYVLGKSWLICPAGTNIVSGTETVCFSRAIRTDQGRSSEERYIFKAHPDRRTQIRAKAERYRKITLCVSTFDFVALLYPKLLSLANKDITRLRIIVSTFEKGFRQKLLSVSTFEKTTSAKMFLMSTFEKANQK